MRDFPVFTTENGVGSLVLKEIPYSGIAYVTIQNSLFPTVFMQECLSFCRAVGAETVYASGNEILVNYPFFTSVIQMTAATDVIPQSDASVFPVTDQTVNRWQEIYNRKMKKVDNASHMTDAAAKEMLNRGSGYFIHRNGNLVGIGMVGESRIECIASVAPGGGREAVCALSHALMGERVVLEVASTNQKAIRLYESLGFIQTAELSRWYKIS